MRRFALIRGYMLSGCLLLAAPLWVAEVVFSRDLDELRPQGQLPLAQLPAPGIWPPDTRLGLFGSRALGLDLADDAELTRQLAEGENIL